MWKMFYYKFNFCNRCSLIQICFSFVFLKFLLISSKLLNFLGMKLLFIIAIPYYAFNVSRVCGDLYSFVPDISKLCFLSLILISLFRDLLIFQINNFGLFNILLLFKYLLFLICALIFTFSFHIITLCLICFFFFQSS